MTYCTSTNMLRLIAFSTSLITILDNVFATLRHSRYKEFVEQVGRTIRYILPYNILTHHSHTRSLAHSLTHSLARSLTHTHTHLQTHSLPTHSHTHSHIHSLTLSMFSLREIHTLSMDCNFSIFFADKQSILLLITGSTTRL